MWPAIIFLSLVALVLIQFFWQDRRFRRQRVKAQQAFTAAALQKEKEPGARARDEEHALYDSMVEGVLVLGVNGRVQLINQSLLRIFDLPGSIEGQTMTEAFRSPDLTDLVRRLKRERRISDVELQMGHAPRRVLAVNAAAILDRDGLEQGAIFVFHDLTRIKELENTRREFVANVSHELRTPLSLIKGFTETLLDGAKDKPEVAARFLQKIERHSDRLLFLIEDLLTISKLESGEAILNIRPVPLRSLADGVLDSLASHSSARQITMENRIDEFVLASGDADSLEQVFWNLVENAIKNGKKKGTVSIEAKAGPEKFWEISGPA